MATHTTSGHYQRTHAALLLLSVVLCTGCGGAALQQRFAAETGCKSKTTIRELGAGAYRVKGCGISRQYTCATDPRGLSAVCVRESREREVAYAPPARPTPESQPSASRVSRSISLEGQARLEALIAGETRIRILALPTRDPDHVSFVFVRDSETPFSDACEVRLVANGVPVEVPMGETKSLARRQELLINLPVSTLARVARADRVVGMLCGARFELHTNAINIMREMLMRIQEELALEGAAPSSATLPVSDSL